MDTILKLNDILEDEHLSLLISRNNLESNVSGSCPCIDP